MIPSDINNSSESRAKENKISVYKDNKNLDEEKKKFRKRV